MHGQLFTVRTIALTLVVVAALLLAPNHSAQHGTPNLAGQSGESITSTR